MKVASLETLTCDAGWRPWIFLKATTDDGLVGWAEITDSHGSPRGLAGIVEDLAPRVLGRDPRPVEAIYWDLYRATRQSPGSIIAKALAGIENALLDQSGLEVAWHAGQYQALPEVYVQNSALEIAWTRVVAGTGTREGSVLAPFLTAGLEGFNVDDEEDWQRAERLVAAGEVTLTEVDRPPYAPTS